MKEKITLEDVRKIFIELEKKFNVYLLNEDSIYYWKLVRFELFTIITKKLNILEDGHPFSKKDKFYRLIRLVKYSTLNFFLMRKIKKSDILILTHGRKQKIQDKYIDIYLFDIIESLIKEKKSFFIIDRPDHYGHHYSSDYENMIYFERFGHIIREGFNRLFFNNIDLYRTSQVLNNIENHIKSKLNIEINLTQLVKKRIFRFRLEKKYFDKIINKVKPKKVILVASYGKEELIASAHEKSIEVVEVQHGVISNYHMGYYFPFKHPIPYFPDKILLFGEYWRESVRFPQNSIQKVHSFSFLKKSNNNDTFVNKSEEVIFISQGSIGEQLSKIAAHFVNENNVMCYYKLHPSEYSNWKNKYHELAVSAEKGRIKVISSEKSIYELFNVCKYAIGVYSTAIYEALIYDCKTYLVNIEGYQHMKYLIDYNYVKLLPQEFSLNDLKCFKNKPIINKFYFYS